MKINSLQSIRPSDAAGSFAPPLMGVRSGQNGSYHPGQPGTFCPYRANDVRIPRHQQLRRKETASGMDFGLET